MSYFVKSCLNRNGSENYHESKQKLLKFLTISDLYWTDKSVGFILFLPQCLKYEKAYNHIIVRIDRFSKMKNLLL